MSLLAARAMTDSLPPDKANKLLANHTCKHCATPNGHSTVKKHCAVTSDSCMTKQKATALMLTKLASSLTNDGYGQLPAHFDRSSIMHAHWPGACV